MSPSTSDYFFSPDGRTKERFQALRKEIRESIRQAEQNIKKLKRLRPLSGDIKRDRKILDTMHDLSLAEATIEERALVAALEASRLKQRLFNGQRKGGKRKIPDFEIEGIFLQMKADRVEQTLRSINQELEEWLRKLRAPFLT